MLDIQLIREKPEEVRAALARRGIDPPIDRILGADSLSGGHLCEVEERRDEG